MPEWVGGHGHGKGLTEKARFGERFAGGEGQQGKEHTRQSEQPEERPSDRRLPVTENLPTRHHRAQCGCSRESGERAGRGRGPSEREWGDMIPGPRRPWQGLHRGTLNTEVMSSDLPLSFLLKPSLRPPLLDRLKRGKERTWNT